MALPDYFMQELKSRCDIADIVSSYVTLKRSGKNLLGLCPFHNEKSPSFHVNAENGYFHCFGCGAGGDVITFIRKIENLDYIEAVKLLAARAGMQMPDDGVDDSMSKLRARVLEINRETARFYHSCLLSPEGKPGLDYFIRRGMSMQLMKHFGLGYSPGSRFALVNRLKQMGYTNDELVQANVAFLSKNGNPVDRFHSRVMFPIIDLRGNVVAFGGRILTDEKPKYINTSDTPVYHKSSGLFAMNFAKNSGEQIILAEGYMDVISLHGAGFTGAIASLGTSLTTEQARIIARYAKEIIICYDSDEAGQKATQRAIPILRNAGLPVKVLSIPGNKDPDEFIRQGGRDGPVKFKALLEACGNDVEYRLEKLKRSYDVTTADGKVKYLTAAAEILGALENNIEREVYAGKLSMELQVDKSAILAQVNKNSKKASRQKEQQSQREIQKELSGLNDKVNPEKAGNLRIANAEEGMIAYLFSNPDGIGYFRDKLPPEKLCTEFGRRVYSYIMGKNIVGSGLSLSDFSGDFSEAELAAISRILARYAAARPNRQDAEEYRRLILQEAPFANIENIKNADMDDLSDYFKGLRDSKK